MKNRVTELLGIAYPIIQGGMMWYGKAPLVSAVSNAGGLGILTALTQPTPEELAKEIARTRNLTDKPFGVNLTILPSISPPPYAEYLAAALDSGVRIIETAGTSPGPYLPAMKAAGAKVIHKCTSVRHALSAEKIGVDIISIDGFECAGHPGEDDVGGLVLIPAAARALSIPVVASGGIGDGRGMAAALAMGAEGINMGTRFCATREAPVHEAIKQAMVDASERDTTLVFRSYRNTGRVLTNPISEEVVAHERQGAPFEDIRHLASGARGKATLDSGEFANALVWGGQVVGLIDDIPSCAELVTRIVSDCRERLSTAQAYFC
ncbi:nitronate monooxygenase [Novosphingobium malaysiense]|uniref:Nitronate monooxygenase n=2 Tax=Novosphingobium malaysiense TaxID=1348853 RepID=A0A0B1ZIP6_9SPHN|nr:nitronate monooxygenase [Novosphingobium malaysiense]